MALRASAPPPCPRCCTHSRKESPAGRGDGMLVRDRGRSRGGVLARAPARASSPQGLLPIVSSDEHPEGTVASKRCNTAGAKKFRCSGSNADSSSYRSPAACPASAGWAVAGSLATIDPMHERRWHRWVGATAVTVTATVGAATFKAPDDPGHFALAPGQSYTTPVREFGAGTVAIANVQPVN